MAGALQLEINSSAMSGGNFSTGASIDVPALPYRPPAPTGAAFDWKTLLGYLGIGITLVTLARFMFRRKAG